MNAAIMVTRHRRFVHLAATHENMNADNVDMIPVGILRRDVWTAVNPRLLTMIPLKVIRPKHMSAVFVVEIERQIYSPPFGTLIAILNRNMIQVFGSIMASTACSFFHVLLTMPVLFSARRVMIQYFSCSFRNQAFIGVSGRYKKANIDHVRDIDPIYLCISVKWPCNSLKQELLQDTNQ